jgi:hypothetical protein
MYFGANTTWTKHISYHKKNWNHKINGVVEQNYYKSSSITTLVVLEIICCLVKIQNMPKTTLQLVTINDGVNGADLGCWWWRNSIFLLERNMIIKKNTYLFLQCELMGHQFCSRKSMGLLSIIIRGLGNYKEDFMSSTTSILNFAKLRASWGQNGNQILSLSIFLTNCSAFPGYFLVPEIVSGTTAYLKQYQI